MTLATLYLQDGLQRSPLAAAATLAPFSLAVVAGSALGTAVPETLRGTAAGIINTAAQLGTAIGIAVLWLVAAATTGAPGDRPPVIAWAGGAAIAAGGALAFSGCLSRRRMVSLGGAFVRRDVVNSHGTAVSWAGHEDRRRR